MPIGLLAVCLIEAVLLALTLAWRLLYVRGAREALGNHDEDSLWVFVTDDYCPGADILWWGQFAVVAAISFQLLPMPSAGDRSGIPLLVGLGACGSNPKQA
jgi:hypothetical protein